MIDINLIPAALRKDGKGSSRSFMINIPKEVLLGVGEGLILFLLTVHIILGDVWWGVGMSRLAGYRQSWQKVLPDKIILDAIKQQTRDLKKEIKLISDMTTKHSVLWSPKFNAISDSLPRGLWIRKMTLDKVGLTMEGSGISKSRNEINNVGMFLAALKQNDTFMNGFSSLEVNSIQRGKSNMVEVTDFTVTAKLNENKLK